MWRALQYSRLSSLNYLPFPALCIPGYLKLNPSADLPKRTLLVIISQSPPLTHPDLSSSHQLSPNPSLRATPLQRNESFGKRFEVWGLKDSHCLGPDNTVYSQWAEVGQKVYLAVLRMFTLTVSTAELAASRLHASSLCFECLLYPPRPALCPSPPTFNWVFSKSLSSDTDFVYSARPLLRLWMSMHACMSSHARRLLLHKISHQ